MEQIIDNLSAQYILYFGTYSVVAAQTLPWVIEFWNRTFKPKNAKWKSRWSWIIPIILHLVAWGLGQILKTGFLYEVHWVATLVFGAWSAMLANVTWNNVTWVKELIGSNLDIIINFINKQFGKKD